MPAAMPASPPVSIGHDAPPSDGGDPVQEEHGLRAFAQHREPDDDQQHRAFAPAVADRAADAARVGGERRAVRRHPQVVPGEHDDGDAQHRRVEEFLADAARQFGDALGAERDDAGAGEPGDDARREPAVAAGHGARRGGDDADDQRGLEDFAEDDDGGGEHGDRLVALLGDDHALRGLFVVFADERIAARLERPDEDRRRRLAGDHLFAVERMALEFLGRRIAVLDDELDLLSGGHDELGRLELVVLDHELELVVGRRSGQGKGQAGREGKADGQRR